MYVKTVSEFQVVVYFGKEWGLLESPIKNRWIAGYLPSKIPFIGSARLRTDSSQWSRTQQCVQRWLNGFH